MDALKIRSKVSNLLEKVESAKSLDLKKMDLHVQHPSHD